jgi:hypothetical protein
MAFLVGLLSAAQTGLVAGGSAMLGAGVEATAVSGGIEATAVTGGAETANGLNAAAQTEMMTAPEGMVEQCQSNGNSLEAKSEQKNNFDLEGEVKKAFVQEQMQAADKRRKEVENQLVK